MSTMNTMSPTLYQNLVYFFIAISSAAIFIIFITHNANSESSLNALIGSYSGIMLCLVGIIMINLNSPNFKNSSSLLSCCSLLVIIAILIAILYTYFNKIATSQVSDYYNKISLVTSILVMVQVYYIMSSLYSSSSGGYFSLSVTQRSFLVVVSVITYVALIALIITLKLYSTQG